MGLFGFLARLGMTLDYHDKTNLSQRMRNQSMLGDYEEKIKDYLEENSDDDTEDFHELDDYREGETVDVTDDFEDDDDLDDLDDDNDEDDEDVDDSDS